MNVQKHFGLFTLAVASLALSIAATHNVPNHPQVLGGVLLADGSGPIPQPPINVELLADGSGPIPQPPVKLLADGSGPIPHPPIYAELLADGSGPIPQPPTGMLAIQPNA